MSFCKPLIITALQKSQNSAQTAPRTGRTPFFVRQKPNFGKILDIFLYFKRMDRTLFSFSRIREFENESRRDERLQAGAKAPDNDTTKEQTLSSTGADAPAYVLSGHRPYHLVDANDIEHRRRHPPLAYLQLLGDASSVCFAAPTIRMRAG